MPGLLEQIIFGPQRRRRLDEAQTAFNTALGSFTDIAPGQQGPPIPGSESGMLLQPSQAAGLENLFRASPQLGSQMLSQLLNANQNAFQNSQAREIQWANVENARESHALAERSFAQRRQEWERSINPILLRQDAMAKDTGALFVPDNLQGGRLVRTPAPGTDTWRELTEGAQAAADAAETWQALTNHVAQNGQIEDPSEAGFGVQDSLRTQLAFSIKEATKAGALDQGLLDTVERLTGSPLDSRTFFLGNDAEVLGRLHSTGRMFENALDRSAEQVRLIQGWNPAIEQSFNAVRSNTQAMQQSLPGIVNQIRQRPGSDVTERAPRSQMGLPTDLGGVREFGSVIGSQIDNISSAILGALVTRGMR